MTGDAPRPTGLTEKCFWLCCSIARRFLGEDRCGEILAWRPRGTERASGGDGNVEKLAMGRHAIHQTGHSTAIAATIVAVAALGVSVWEGCQTRRHFRMSVNPKLVFELHANTKNKEVILAVFNRGFGPAIIEDFSVLVDDKEVTEIGRKGMSAIRDALKKCDGRLGDEKAIRIGGFVMQPGDCIAPSQGSTTVIAIRGADGAWHGGLTERYADILRSHVRAVIHYRPIYGERLDTRATIDSGDGPL